ncbi:thioesterase family protein [Acidiferrimicrobium sp. IK]|uniref:acyl-CoA thioesterase n=1 Tax=Acidiferrimicrobium sp. IK TaxID=2871700 RepID=UPI0021CB3FF9|nr:acyl-CoA thioesterase domain-containing protein [Acidiferrimicrobium sp. IK]MCU4184485.1 thioesterase family protein [Acidiferrimicrobium sp. IK]
MRTATTLTEILDLEALDRDLYRGFNQPSRGQARLYGGQVAAQCLMAASLTVPEGRRPHSLHGYFLRAGKPDWPVILRVDRDRDGRSFSARHVEAVQHGEVIFTMSASFHVKEDGVQFSRQPAQVPPDPEMLPSSDRDWVVHGLFDQRWLGDAEDMAGQMWVKVRQPVGPDPILQACALAYLSDFGAAFPEPRYAREGWGGPSLDHAIWFHQPIDADDWVFLDLLSWTAMGGRSLYSGALRNRDGQIGAVLAQEHLLRPGARPA